MGYTTRVHILKSFKVTVTLSHPMTLHKCPAAPVLWDDGFDLRQRTRNSSRNGRDGLALLGQPDTLRFVWNEDSFEIHLEV